MRTAPRATPTPVPRRVEFFHPCSRTWLCPCSTSTSPSPGSNARERARRRRWRRRRGLANYRLVRYADDWVLAVSGTKAHAEALRVEASEVLSTMGLRLSPEKTLITHIDEGFDFLGWRIQRHRKRGTSNTYYVYVYPAKKALNAAMAEVKGDLLAEHEPAARRPADPAQPVSAGLDRPLPIRLFQRDLQLPAGLHLEAGLWMAAPQTPAQHLEATPSPQHQRRMVARHSGCGTCSTRLE